MKLIELLLTLYRWLISPFIHTWVGAGYGCRFQPTCSDYSHQAFRQFGFFKGLLLSLLRILRCNPFSTSRYDPLPVISRASIKSNLNPVFYAENQSNFRTISRGD